MIRCQHCHAQSMNYLCDNCTIQLANMLDQLPWLLDELDARIQKLDRIGVGTIGRNRRPDELNVMDFDAAETARKIRKTLQKWVETVAQSHTGRPPAALGTVSSQELARWLYVNVDAIARLDLAERGRHRLYDDITRLVGTPQQRGQLINAINSHQRDFAGPCPTITGYHGNDPIECGTILYADIDDTTVLCPTCKQTIDVERNRRRARKERDLVPKNELEVMLANIGEPVTTKQLDHWIAARRLRIRGYLHDGEMHRFRTNEHSIPLYSVSRARKLRRRDQHLRQEAKAQ